MDGLFNKTINVLSGMLGYRTKRHEIIVSNITNIDTSNYKPSDVSFKSELGEANKVVMTTTDPRHIAPGKNAGGSIDYEIKQSAGKVTVDTEMANLAENNLMYNTTVQMLARKFKGLETVLKETK
jgi:flagellar basal-body rod protein FlgB